MLVLVIIAVLLAIATATFLNQQDKAHDTSTKTDLGNLARIANADYIQSTNKTTNLVGNPLMTSGSADYRAIVGPGTTNNYSGRSNQYSGQADGSYHEDLIVKGGGYALIQAAAPGNVLPSVIAGKTYTLSWKITSPDLPVGKQPAIGIRWRRADNTIITPYPHVATSGQGDVATVTATAPADATSAELFAGWWSGFGKGLPDGTAVSFYASQPMFTQTFAAPSQFFPTVEQLSSGAAEWNGPSDDATSTITSASTNAFPEQIAGMIADTEPEYTITSTGLYPTDPKTIDIQYVNADKIILRATSSDGVHYNDELDYTDKQRKQLRFTGTDELSQTNLIPNPSFEDGTKTSYAGWDVKETVIRGRVASHGRYFMRASNNTADAGFGPSIMISPIIVGDDYSCSMDYLAGDAGSARAAIKWYDGPVVLTTTYGEASGPGSRPSVVSTAPPGSTRMSCYLVIGTSSPLGAYIDSDGWAVYQGDTTVFMDGSYPDAVWNGTANASTSTGYAWDTW